MIMMMAKRGSQGFGIFARRYARGLTANSREWNQGSVIHSIESPQTSPLRASASLLACRSHQEAIKRSFFGLSRASNEPWQEFEVDDDSPESVEKWLLSLLQTNKEYANKRSLAKQTDTHAPVVFFGTGFRLHSDAYLRVLESYAAAARSKDRLDAPQKAEYWLGIAERHHRAAVELYMSTYGHSIGSSEQNEAAMIVRGLCPQVDFYNAIIDAWSHSRDTISVVRAKRWLSKLEDGEREDGVPSFLLDPPRPNARSYDLYMNAISRGLGKNKKTHVLQAIECEDLLKKRMKPDAPSEILPTTESFNFAIRAWTRCRHEKTAAGKVMDLLLKMEKFQKEHMLADRGMDVSWMKRVSPDTKTYCMAIDAWVIKASLKAKEWHSNQRIMNNRRKQINQSRKDAGKRLADEDTRFAANSGGADGSKEMQNAENILKYVHDLQSLGHDDVRASVIGYNIILSGWARLSSEFRPEISLKCEQILNDMRDLAEHNSVHAPDVVSFNAVIKSWINSKKTNAGGRCEYWLRRMLNESGDEGHGFICPPNTQTYNLVMDCRIQDNSPELVENLLIEMLSSGGRCPPNSESFSKVIRAWVQDELEGREDDHRLPGSSLANSLRWLQELLEREGSGDVKLGPAPELFLLIIKGAARSRAASVAVLETARKTMELYKQSRFRVDGVAYVFMLDITLRVSPEEVEVLFSECCRDGLLTRDFVQKMIESTPKDERKYLCEELLGNPPTFAVAWSRGVDRDRRPGEDPEFLKKIVPDL